MTPQERRVAAQTGRIISSVRKSKGLTQSTIASQLAVSQSALSKIEHGLLIPSVHQWFEFCKFTGVPVESHILGYIDYSRPVQRMTQSHEGGFRLPKAYAVERGSTVRTMLPLIHWLETNLGEKKANAVLEDMGMDRDYFVQLDHTVGIQFGLDLILYLSKNGLYNAAELPAIFKPIKQRSYHGALWAGYEQTHEPLELVNLLLSRAQYYEANFDYTIEAHTKKHVDFSSKPGDHFKTVKTLMNHEGLLTICPHRKGYFEQMASISREKPVHAEELGCAFRGQDKCTFRLSIAQ